MIVNTFHTWCQNVQNESFLFLPQVTNYNLYALYIFHLNLNAVIKQVLLPDVLTVSGRSLWNTLAIIHSLSRKQVLDITGAGPIQRRHVPPPLCARHTVSRSWISVTSLLPVAAAESTQQTPSDEEDSGAGPAEEKCCSQLSFLTYMDGWIVEIPDDDIGRPAHRNQNEDTCQDEENSRSPQKVCLGSLISSRALDLLHTTDANKQSNQGESHGHTHEGPGCF